MTDLEKRALYSSSVSAQTGEPEWVPAFHGTWFYGLWNLLLTGQISASDDMSKGHEFNKLGAKVYCTPMFDTAISYGRAHNVFGDGIYHRVVLELRVRKAGLYKKKREGGVQWTFPAEEVVIAGFWLCHNCGNDKGYAHLRYWDPDDECIPVGCEKAWS